MAGDRNHRVHTVLAVAGLLALAGVLGLALPGRRAAPNLVVDVATVPGEAPPAAERGTPAATRERPSERRLVPATGPLPGPAPWCVTGRCVDPAFRPVAGARVRATVRHGAGEAEPVVLDQWLRADRDGVFRWCVPEPGRTAFLRLAPDQEQWTGTPVELVLAAGAPSPAAVELRLVPLDLLLRGVVTDATGAPLPEATVGLGLRPVLTAACDGDGRYTLRGASAISGHRLFARAPGHASRSALVPDSQHAREHTLDFVLGPEAVVLGTVRDPSGAPVAEALVASALSWTSARSGADGSFRLGGQDPTARHTVVAVTKPGFVPWSQRVVVAGASTRLDVVLRRGVALSGLVVDARQRPVAGAALRVDWLAVPWAAPSAVSGPDGGFVLPCLEPVEHLLYASHAEAGAAVLPVAAPFDAPLRILLLPARQLQGVVRSAAGAPVPHAEVRCAARDLEPGSCRADGAGRFQFTGLPEGSFYLEALAPGWQQVRSAGPQNATLRGEGPIAAGRTDVVLLMARNAGLSGRVVDDRTGQPIPRFRIRFVRVVEKRPEDRPEAGGYAAVWLRDGLRFVDPAGTWCTGEQEALPPGQPFAVEAWAEGYAPAIAERVLARPDPRPDDCVLRLRPGAELAGLVVRKDSGAPIASALVTLVPARHPLTAQEYPHATVTTGADGSFRFVDVAPGEVSLLVRAPSLPAVLDGPLAVRADGALRHTVAVGAGAACAGVILEESGQPVPHAAVELLPQELPAAPGDRSVRTTRADAAGRFAFAGLCAGLYQLTHREGAGVAGTAATTRWVSLARDEARELSFDPRSGSATLRADVRVDGVAPAQVVFELRYVRERDGVTVPWTQLPPMYTRRVPGGTLLLGHLAGGTAVLGMRIQPVSGPMQYRRETVVLLAGAVTEVR